MKRRMILTIALTVALLSVAVSAGAITWGEPDTENRYPLVGTLLFRQNGVGWYSCTGTLLSSKVMLTAGHCVEEAGNVNDVTYVRFAQDAMAGYENYNSTQEWLDKEWILAKQVIPHPQYDDYSGFPLTYDVGLVILSKPVRLNVYGKLPKENFLETVLAGAKHQDNRFTVVGFGSQGILKPIETDEYARYIGEASLIELNSALAGGASAKFTNNPGGGNGSGGTCFGDSGGPVFYQDTNVIGAIVSWGNTPCIGVDYQFRMDTATALDFVNQYLR